MLKTMLRRFLTPVCLLALSAFATAQERIRDVVYQKRAGFALTMDVFKPAKPNGIGVIFVVSGGWVSSHDMISPEVARPFTDRGITVFEVVHGAQPKFLVPEIVTDVQRAVRFVRSNAKTYGVDENRLGIFGASAGGHLSLMVGGLGVPGNVDAKDPVDRVSSGVQAVGAYYPPTDMLNYGKEGQKAFELPMLSVFFPAFGITKATPKEQLDTLAEKLSPIKLVTANYPPTYLIQGDKDPLVPPQQAQIFIAALTEKGVKNTLVIVPNAAHDAILLVSPEASKLADWFVQTLGK